MMRIKYYFRYNNLPVILPLAYKKIHYNCYNYDSSNIKDVFKLLRHETKISVISENECNDLFKNEVFNLFGNVKMIDLQRKPSLNFFDKKSSSKMMESNRYVSKVFSLILETEKFNKIIERMLNSFIYSGGELILKNFLEKYIKNSGSMEEFPMNQRMKLINYFEIENPQFLTPKNDSKIDISYYFNLSKLSEKESEIYLLILSSQNKGSIILDLKKSKHIRPINSGYFFHLFDKVADGLGVNFKPKENHIKNQHKIDLEEGKKVRGFSFLERPMQEQVVFLFKDFFPNYEPVESIYSLINDPDLNYFMYFNQKHLLCIIDENMPNIKDIPSVLSNYQDYNILVIINGKIPSGNAWKNKKDYSFVTYWDFLVNLSKNVIFVNKEEFGKNAIYIESLIDDSCDGSLSCFF